MRGLRSDRIQFVMSAINGKTVSEGRNEEGSQANPRKNNDKFKASAAGH